MPAAVSENPPRSRVRPMSAAVLLIVLSLVLLMIPLPQLGRVSDALGDLLHVPLFALLAVVVRQALLHFRPDGRRFANITAWLSVSALGIAAEYLQQFVGREASVGDGLADVLGAAAGIACLESVSAASGFKRRMCLLFAAAAVMFASLLPVAALFDVVRQTRQMPVIATFEDELELTRWDAHDSQLRRVKGGMCVDCDVASHPGAIMRWPPRDWSRYRNLVVRACCEEGERLTLTVKIQDEFHNNQRNDRFQSKLDLTGEMSEFVIPFSEVIPLQSGRHLDLKQVSLLQFYISNPDRPRMFLVSTIHLE